MAKYGVTWWGEQWLNSLARIDFSNRLPRGRSYAGNGSVKKIEIEKNKVIAKVKGSYPSPYKISITVPEFTDKQKQALETVIRSNPQLLSKLLNKELSPELDTLAKKEGIHIFPASWKDFGMHCSCPDSAVPCKHLAAVLYLVANEIDKNPFMVLNLHGVDLLSLFEKEGNVSNTIDIPETEQLISAYIVPKVQSFAPENIINIDLSKLSVNPPDIYALLAAAPVFYPKDFKEYLQKATNSVSKYIGTIKSNSASVVELFDIDSSVTIVFNKEFSVSAAEIVSNESTTQVSAEMLASVLNSIEDKQLIHLHPSWVFIHKIYLFALQLASNKLYYPQLRKADSNSYVLQYIPAVFCAEVKTIVMQLHNNMPSGLIEVRNTDKKNSKYCITETEQQLNLLCSVFLNYFISGTYINNKFPAFWYNKSAAETQVLDLFIEGHVKGFNTFETLSIPASIHQWLSVFDIHSRKYTPVLQVEENKSDFALSLLVDDAEMASPVALFDVFRLKKYDKNRLEVLKDLSIVGNYLPQVNAILSTQGKEDVVVNLTEFSKLLINVLPVVKLLGVNIILPKSLKSLVHPQLSLQLKKSQGKQTSIKSLVGLTEMLDYDWQITLGDKQMDVNEFMQMVKGLQGLVKLRDQYIFLDEAELKSLQRNIEKNNELSSFRLIQAALAEELDGMPVGLSSQVVELVKDLLKSSPPKLPKGLNATLRPYQQRGFEWMARNTDLGMGSIIADDMGLGKTIQVICLLLHYKNQGLLSKNKALVVAPTTLISNWEREIARFAPSLAVYIYHGASRSAEFSDKDIVITSFGMVRNSLNVFEKVKWHSVVIDEAQNIKNPSSEQTKSIKKLKADIRIAMSGTPVENRLSEYWSIFDFANKGYLGSYNSFNESFAKPIHFNHDMAKVESFKRITAPFLLRRLKTDKSIISDLPDKVENNHFTELSKNQAALYQSIVNQTINQIENADGIVRKGLVLKLMMALKQIGNHPFQYIKKGEKEPSLSGKSLLLLELVESIVENDEKVLIFTQFREMGDLLSEFITQATKEKPLFLHGGCSRTQRDEMVNKFQTSHNQVFILSLKAGGTGLNLTAASHVVHYDLWWNPAVESQATDRAYRIGQKKNVMVYRLINKGTIEEKIDKMIQEKRSLADLTVATGEAWLGTMSNEELKELVKLEF